MFLANVKTREVGKDIPYIPSITHETRKEHIMQKKWASTKSLGGLSWVNHMCILISLYICKKKKNTRNLLHVADVKRKVGNCTRCKIEYENVQENNIIIYI